MKNLILILVVGFFLVSFSKSEENYILKEQDSKLLESIKRGKELYTDMCVFCHLSSGKGKAKIFPPLAQSDYLMEKREESIRAIKYGMQGEIVVNGVTYNKKMAKPGLDDDEVADVMNYITNSWGNKNNKMVTIKEVEAISKE